MKLENVSRDDWILAGVALLLLITLVALPWFSISVGPFTVTSTATGSPDGWLGILGVLALAALIADLAVRAPVAPDDGAEYRWQPRPDAIRARPGRRAVRRAEVSLPHPLLVFRMGVLRRGRSDHRAGLARPPGAQRDLAGGEQLSGQPLTTSVATKCAESRRRRMIEPPSEVARAVWLSVRACVRCLKASSPTRVCGTPRLKSSATGTKGQRTRRREWPQPRVRSRTANRPSHRIPDRI